MLRENPTLDYKLVFAHMHEGVIIIDSLTQVVFANSSYYEILGIPVDTIQGKPLRQSQPNARIIEVLETGIPIINSEFLVDTTNIRVVANIIPIKKNQEIVGAVSVFRDVTEVTELTKELERLKNYTKYLEDELMNRKKKELFTDLVGKDEQIMTVVKKIEKVAPTESTVLITGESGTGKEIVANTIYQASLRTGLPFIKVNCAAIPEALLESEFFGYEEGAFTGSRKGGKAGKFELAEGGTIFLDEVGEMPLNLQVKLLRAIQERTVERVGGNTPIKVNVRIIAATNANLKKRVNEGQFREDLYFRLNVFPIELPPLRSRKMDIMPLAVHFLKEYSNLQNKQLSFTAEVQNLLTHYHWPGNIRELKNVIEHAVIMAEKSGRITSENLPDYLNSMNESDGVPDDDYVVLYRRWSEIEKLAIEEALERTQGHRTEAMKLLGMSRKKFYKKLKEYLIM
jgi:PAS domain S-box-containing protein